MKPHGIDVVIIEPGLIETGFGGAVVTNFQSSEDSAYAGIIEKLRAAAQEGGAGSPPGVITNLVVRAINAARPKTRYAAGRMGPLAMFMRWLLPDRWFDRIIMSQFT